MTSVINNKTASGAQRGNQAQERLYIATAGAAAKPATSASDQDDDRLTCLGCGARVESSDDLTCGH